jgi:predicted HTH transcriptional regulator
VTVKETPKASTPVDAEKLMNKRSSSFSGENLESDESQIMQYVREHGMINNTDCRELLQVDRHRANYLLKKLNQYDLLQIVGTGRWAVYRLNDH